MPGQAIRYQDCYFTRDGDTATLGNSRMERAWRIGPGGLSTVRFLDKRTGRDWAAGGSRESVLTTENGLVGLGELATGEACAEVVETPISETCLRVRFALKGGGLVVWKCFDVFAGAPAVRAWVEVRSEMDRSNLDYTQVESLALDLSGANAACVELHDLTDATNHLVTVREADLTEPRRMVGNNLFVETDAGEGVFAYKESPVPNSQLYHLYHDFELDAEKGTVHAAGALGQSPFSLAGVGAGFHNLPAGQVRRTYAFAVGVYSGGRDGGILALKEYQAARYRLVPERDYILAANSWGSFHTDIDETKMMREVEVAAELGITSVAVDAGWTRHIMGGEPDPEKFPRGFAPLTTRAKEVGVRLELWTIPNRLHDQLEVLKEHPDWVARTNNLVPCDPYRSYWDTQLLGIDLCNEDCFAWMRDYYLSLYDMGFERFKIDTFQCDGYDTLLGDLYDHYEALRRLMEELVTLRPGLTFTQDSTRTNRPIYDYYMDYGIIFLENRYMPRPVEHNGRYHPWKTLRNLWQIAPYIPPQKLNMELINDQEGYSPEYLLATVMMANPLFWEALAGVSEESRQALKPAIALYKQHQAAIYAGHIFPIGDMPDGTTWTGFQSHSPDTGCGYLLVFREDNPDASRRFHPKFLSRPTRFESVTDNTPAFTIDRPQDDIEIALPHPRAFRLYRYGLDGGEA
jgi:alpha-galactosidase